MGLYNKLNIKSQAETIRYEEKEGLNTAERIGKVLVDLIEATDSSLFRDKEAIRDLINQKKLKSVEISVNETKATLILSSEDEILQTDVPLATTDSIGMMSAADKVKLQSAYETTQLIKKSAFLKIRLFAGFFKGISNDGKVDVSTLENNEIVFDREHGLFKYVEEGTFIGAAVGDYNSYTRLGTFVGLCNDTLFQCKANGKLYRAVNWETSDGKKYFDLVEHNKVPDIGIDMGQSFEDAIDYYDLPSIEFTSREGLICSLLAGGIGNSGLYSCCTNLTLKMDDAVVSMPVSFTGDENLDCVRADFMFEHGNKFYKTVIKIFPVIGDSNSIILSDEKESFVKIEEVMESGDSLSTDDNWHSREIIVYRSSEGSQNYVVEEDSDVNNLLNTEVGDRIQFITGEDSDIAVVASKWYEGNLYYIAAIHKRGIMHYLLNIATLSISSTTPTQNSRFSLYVNIAQDGSSQVSNFNEYYQFLKGWNNGNKEVTIALSIADENAPGTVYLSAPITELYQPGNLTQTYRASVIYNDVVYTAEVGIYDGALDSTKFHSCPLYKVHVIPSLENDMDNGYDSGDTNPQTISYYGIVNIGDTVKIPYDGELYSCVLTKEVKLPKWENNDYVKKRYLIGNLILNGSSTDTTTKLGVGFCPSDNHFLIVNARGIGITRITFDLGFDDKVDFSESELGVAYTDSNKFPGFESGIVYKAFLDVESLPLLFFLTTDTLEGNFQNSFAQILISNNVVDTQTGCLLIPSTTLLTSKGLFTLDGSIYLNDDTGYEINIRHMGTSGIIQEKTFEF